jgi:hypothetical protein
VRRAELNMGLPLGTKKANILVVRHSVDEIAASVLSEDEPDYQLVVDVRS